MTDREALKLALETLEEIADEMFSPYDNKLGGAILAIRKVLAQPEQEPVAWWATREYFYRELERSVDRVRKEMEIKSVTMRCKDYDLVLPIIDTHFGRVLVGQGFPPPKSKAGIRNKLRRR